MSEKLRNRAIRLAYSKPELRKDLLPIIVAYDKQGGRFMNYLNKANRYIQKAYRNFRDSRNVTPPSQNLRGSFQYSNFQDRPVDEDRYKIIVRKESYFAGFVFWSVHAALTGVGAVLDAGSPPRALGVIISDRHCKHYTAFRSAKWYKDTPASFIWEKMVEGDLLPQALIRGVEKQYAEIFENAEIKSVGKQ